MGLLTIMAYDCVGNNGWLAGWIFCDDWLELSLMTCSVGFWIASAFAEEYWQMATALYPFNDWLMMAI